ncbi:hypothetical protein ES703_93992 [subsurface metagenome]
MLHFASILFGGPRIYPQDLIQELEEGLVARVDFFGYTVAFLGQLHIAVLLMSYQPIFGQGLQGFGYARHFHIELAGNVLYPHHLIFFPQLANSFQVVLHGWGYFFGHSGFLLFPGKDLFFTRQRN